MPDWHLPLRWSDCGIEAKSLDDIFRIGCTEPCSQISGLRQRGRFHPVSCRRQQIPQRREAIHQCFLRLIRQRGHAFTHLPFFMIQTADIGNVAGQGLQQRAQRVGKMVKHVQGVMRQLPALGRVGAVFGKNRWYGSRFAPGFAGCARRA